MKKRIVWLIALLLVPGTVAYASPDGFYNGLSINLPGFGFRVGPAGVGLNIGLPWVVGATPGYAYQQPGYAYQDSSYAYQDPGYAYQDPGYAYQPVAIDEPPEFVLPPELGFYVAVGVPYDLFFLNNVYYLCRDNIWYSSPYYYGPWSSIYYNNIPYALSRFPFERIRHFRDDYYGRYQRYGAWDGYRHFRPARHGDYAGVGKVYDRSGHDYGRPNSPAQGYGNRPAFNRPNRDWQGSGSGQTYTRPYNRTQVYGDNRTATRPYYNGQVNAGRPVYSRPNRPEQWSGGRSTSVSPFSFAPGSGNRPVYNRPSRSGQFYGNGASYARPNNSVPAYGGRAPSYRTNYGSRTDFGRPAVYTRPTGFSQGSMNRGMNRGFGQGMNRSGSVTRGWQGQGR